MMRARSLGLLCALVVGCASHHKEPPDDSAAVLTIGPPTSELLIVNDVPATEDFTATLTYPDGTTRDVTTEVAFNIDSGFGHFTTNTLSMQAAGKTTVYATLTDKTAQAQVIGRLKDIRVDPAVPANAPDLFTGTEDPATAPNVVYPPAGVVMPRNLGDFEVHWTDGNAHDIFEISLKTEFADVRAYVPGGNGDQAAGPDASYMAFLATEWLAAVGHETQVEFRVRGVASANPATVGAGAPQMVKLTNEDMLGGLYYWAAASSAGSPEGIWRHDMSMPGQPAQQYMTVVQTSGRCVACHVLSRDGKEMAITYDGGNWTDNNNQAGMVDVASSTRQDLSNKWNFGTFTPDGSKFLAAYNGALQVRKYADQSVIVTMPAAGVVTQPDLSPDGTKLVYVRPASFGTDWSFDGGGIYWRTYDQATDTFGPEMPLVIDGNNNYYPSWSPDGNWVLFNHAPLGGNAYNNASASLYVIKGDGSGPAMELAAADAGTGLTNSWGRWAPFAQTLGANAEPMFWVTVSSKRNFGVRLVNQNRPQIWMTPFFPNQASSSADPSNVAFRLPFQNIDSNNHIAQWTEKVVVTQ